ncbi:MAG: hypothetical protein K8T91_08605 [Planctomycetes bacterium]|nr:hypothetical protein [Planctomycetota bacterium]
MRHDRFDFRLCLALGVIHPDFLERMLSRRQLAEWRRYAELEPWGEERADVRAAQMAMACVQPWTTKRLDLAKFVLTFGEQERPEATADDLKRKAMQATAAMKGTINPPRATPLRYRKGV